MKCYEFNDGKGINFGVIAENMAKACAFAASDMDEDCDEYKVRVLSSEETARRDVTDEDDGRKQSISAWIEEMGNVGAYMLWHSEV